MGRSASTSLFLVDGEKKKRFEAIKSLLKKNQKIISFKCRVPPPLGSGEAGQRMLSIVLSIQEPGPSTTFLRCAYCGDVVWIL